MAREAPGQAAPLRRAPFGVFETVEVSQKVWPEQMPSAARKAPAAQQSDSARNQQEAFPFWFPRSSGAATIDRFICSAN